MLGKGKGGPRARTHLAKLPGCERKMPREFSAPEKNRKQKLLLTWCKGTKVHSELAAAFVGGMGTLEDRLKLFAL